MKKTDASASPAAPASDRVEWVEMIDAMIWLTEEREELKNKTKKQ